MVLNVLYFKKWCIWSHLTDKAHRTSCFTFYLVLLQNPSSWNSSQILLNIPCTENHHLSLQILLLHTIPLPCCTIHLVLKGWHRIKLCVWFPVLYCVSSLFRHKNIDDMLFQFLMWIHYLCWACVVFINVGYLRHLVHAISLITDLLIHVKHHIFLINCKHNKLSDEMLISSHYFIKPMGQNRKAQNILYWVITTGCIF